MKLKYCLAYFAVILLFSAAPASAIVIEYTGSAAFDSAVTGATTYNFENIATNPPGYLAGNVTVGGVTFSAPAIFPFPASTPFVIDGFYTPAPFGGAAFFSGQGPGPAIGPSNATATLGSGVTAIGFLYAPGDNGGGPITVTLSTGDVFNLAVPVPYDTTDFVGFTSSAPITSVTFTEQGYGIDIIQFELGTANSATSVPEPGTLMLLGVALAGLVGFRKKLKRS